jgi:hypothetical protein
LISALHDSPRVIFTPVVANPDNLPRHISNKTGPSQLYVPTLPATPNDEWQIGGEHRHELRLFAKAISRMDGRKQKLLLGLAQKMARRQTNI